MISGSVARRYAKALFAIGEENNSLLGLAREVQRAAEVWSESEQLRSTLTNPIIDLADRKEVWQAIIRKLGISPIGKNFFALLFDKSRLAELPGIARELSVLADKKDNRLRAEIIGATPVTDDVANLLKVALQRRTGKVVVITKKEDPSLLGGIVTKVGDLMYDGSLKTQLARVKESMLGRA